MTSMAVCEWPTEKKDDMASLTGTDTTLRKRRKVMIGKEGRVRRVRDV
jgi:hypothetical protein